jgi:hypothetical protein
LLAVQPHVPRLHWGPFDAPLQSVAVVHPQLLLLHAEPAALFVQSTQALPEAPHVFCAPLPAHCPLLQQ